MSSTVFNPGAFNTVVEVCGVELGLVDDLGPRELGGSRRPRRSGGQYKGRGGEGVREGGGGDAECAASCFGRGSAAAGTDEEVL